jgi:DNA polymerase III alpha subunit
MAASIRNNCGKYTRSPRTFAISSASSSCRWAAAQSPAAVRDAARVLGYPWSVGDKVAKVMPPLIMGRDTPLHACFEENEKYAAGFKMASELREM